MHPFFPFAHAAETGILTTQGNHEAAIQLCSDVPENVQSDPLFMCLAAWSFGKAGRAEKAREYLNVMQRRREEGYFGAAYLSLACLGVGDHQSAMDWAETAVEEYDGLITYAVNMPPFQEIRDEPRFRALLKHMNLE